MIILYTNYTNATQASTQVIHDLGNVIIATGTQDYDYYTGTEDTSLQRLAEIGERCVYDDVPKEELHTLKELNAILATKTMIYMGRNFTPKNYKSRHRKPYRANKMMLSQSGKLSNRLNKIRRNR